MVSSFKDDLAVSLNIDEQFHGQCRDSFITWGPGQPTIEVNHISKMEKTKKGSALSVSCKTLFCHSQFNPFLNQIGRNVKKNGGLNSTYISAWVRPLFRVVTTGTQNIHIVVTYLLTHTHTGSTTDFLPPSPPILMPLSHMLPKLLDLSPLWYCSVQSQLTTNKPLWRSTIKLQYNINYWLLKESQQLEWLIKIKLRFKEHYKLFTVIVRIWTISRFD